MSTPLEETIFLAARDILDPVARAAYLAQICGTDHEMRAAIEARLEEFPTVVDPMIRPSEPAPLEKAGDTIGRYKLLQPLGEGGCGVVYMAEQSSPVKRKVALKVIKLGMDTKNVIARFEAERQALAMMDHPNIAKVFDAGSTDAGRPYFVMELVRGVPITQYCDSHNLPTNARLRLFIDVCHAIQHAHQKGIIHRDIKPSNILVSLHDDAPVPKVIDFGVAKATEARLTDLTLFTEMHAFIGTPAYMSPEQADLTGLDIDTRADIYSLGVLLYELLTGRLPFDPKKLLQSGFDEMRRTIREVPPPRPSTRIGTLSDAERADIAKHRGLAPEQLSSLLRRDLDWIMLKTLEKDRTRRYDTANGLAMDLQRYLANEPVLARPPSTAYLLGKLASRYRGVVAAGTAVFLALCAGIGVSLWQAVRATRAEKMASERFAQAQGARDAAEKLTTEAIVGLREKLLKLGKIEIMEDMVAAADEYYRKLPPELATDVSARHRASLYNNRALIANALGQDEQQEQSTREALRITDQLLAKDPDNETLQDEAAYANLSLCMLYMDRNDHESVVQSADQVVARCQFWLKQHPNTLWALRTQILAHHFAGQSYARYLRQPLEAIARFQTAAELTRRMREVGGETSEVCEAEGLIHYGNANIAGRTNQHDVETEEFLASTASFARALELGGDSALLRELHVGAMHHAGMGVRTRGKVAKNDAEMKRGEAMVVAAYEGRAKLVALEPGRGEWWRDLAYSHVKLADYAAERQDGARELAERRESLRCREEAVQRQKHRPLILVEWAAGASDLAECLLKQTPPDLAEAGELTVRSLETWRRGVEMADLLSINNRQLKGDAQRLAKIATQQDAETTLALLQRATATLAPLVGKVRERNDIAATVVLLAKTRIGVLESLGRSAEVAEARAQLERLSSGQDASPRSAVELARFMLDAAGPRLDAASKLPADQQPTELAKIEADAHKAIALLEPAIAQQPDPEASAALGSAWRVLGRLHRTRGQAPEAVAAFTKAIAQLGDDKNRTARGDAQQELGDFLRDNREFANARGQFRAAIKTRDAQADAPNPTGGVFDRASISWSALSSVEQSLGDWSAAETSLDTAIARQKRALEIEPEQLSFQSRMIELHFNRARLMAQLQKPEATLESVTQSGALLAAFLARETDHGRLNRMSDNAGSTVGKLRSSKDYPASEKLLQHLIVMRQRLEALRGWPEDPTKASLGAQIGLAGLYREQKKNTEALAVLHEALTAANRSARPALIAEAHIRGRAIYDAAGDYEEAERLGRIAYEVTRTTDLGTDAMAIATDFASTLIKRRKFAEAEQVGLAAWDIASTRTWPSEPPRLRHDLALRLMETYRAWANAEPSDARRKSALEWRERQAQAIPTAAKLSDVDLNGVIPTWTWQIARMIEDGKSEDAARERHRVLQLATGRQFAELAQRAAKCALLLPAEGAELQAAADLAAAAFKATPPAAENYDWYALAQGLALIRQHRGPEALALLQPILKTDSADRWFTLRALCALAHQQAGEVEKAQAMLQEVEKADGRKKGSLKDPISQDAAVARVLLAEARAALAPPPP